MIQAIALLPIVFIFSYNTLVGGGLEYRIETLQGSIYSNLIDIPPISTFPLQHNIVTSTSYTPKFCALGPIHVTCPASCYPTKWCPFSSSRSASADQIFHMWNGLGIFGYSRPNRVNLSNLGNCGSERVVSDSGEMCRAFVQSCGPGQERADLITENGGKWTPLFAVPNKSAARFSQSHIGNNVTQLCQARFDLHGTIPKFMRQGEGLGTRHMAASVAATMNGSQISFCNTSIHKSPGGTHRAFVQSCGSGQERADLFKNNGGKWSPLFAVLNKTAARYHARKWDECKNLRCGGFLTRHVGCGEGIHWM